MTQWASGLPGVRPPGYAPGVRYRMKGMQEWSMQNNFKSGHVFSLSKLKALARYPRFAWDLGSKSPFMTVSDM